MAFRSSFSIRKTGPRKFVSRSPLKLPAQELAREFGTHYQTIDTCIGNQKMTYDIAHAVWVPDGTVGVPITSREMSKLEKTKRELEEDNGTLRNKMDMLLQMLAEVTAEYELRRPA